MTADSVAADSDLKKAKRVRLQAALVGCGAIAQKYYASALLALQDVCAIDTAFLFDPEQRSISRLRETFPAALPTSSLNEVIEVQPDFAIVASPPQFHAEQTISLLESGIPVLCEKPMASTISEAQRMVEAANRSGAVLSIGHFRRFYPTSQTIKEIVEHGNLGRVVSFEISEGGKFEWPAQSASFFQKNYNRGGVLFDLGIHCLDLLVWWFGTPCFVDYCDDAIGGLESNCVVRLTFPGEVTGVVRLSRDTDIPNHVIIDCEHGRLKYSPGSADEFEIQLRNTSYTTIGLQSWAGASKLRNYRVQRGLTMQQAFTRQLQQFVQSVRGFERPLVTGRDAMASLRLVEKCYELKCLMPLPWLTDDEIDRAYHLETQ